ncbi:hypothetical protein BDZ85DRAFT_256148 [Elsinoe ampelina]|uniref:Uncharacterized protein n=1 Tax=Elsinoe ampelina TaxID=302913 RepID=A0A6A6GL84_9PEZI|nr:hypothetical protein BDZ85DRAFT_256148 [Elsinoe ampelina]
MLIRNPSPPPSDDLYSLDEYSSDDSLPQDFPLSREEIVTTIRDFYEYLVRLYIPESALKLPPPGGWPNITAASTVDFGKSEFVVDLIRHLPYIEAEDDHDGNRHNINFKCIVQDYSTYTASDFAKPDFGEELAEIEESRTAREHWIVLARGYESYGRYLLLNTATGVMRDQDIRANPWFDFGFYEFWTRFKSEYKNLEIIPIPGFEPGVSDGKDVITTEPPSRQEHDFPSGLDENWVRKIYIDHGWPTASYDKAAALAAIDDFARGRGAFDQDD